MNTRTSLIEPLEARIAPAAVITYTDIDGDVVKITASNGPLDLSDLTLSGGASGQLQKLDLTAAAFRGASITFAVTKGAAGDGLAHVGRIDATGVDLGNVTVKGDLGVIDAGDVNAKTTALKTLSVLSMGRFGLSTQGGTGNLASDIVGRLDVLKIAGDIEDVFIAVTGGESGTLGSVRVGGSLINESVSVVAGISSSGNMGAIVIRGSADGQIFSDGRMGSVAIGGSLSGDIFNYGDMGSVTVGHDLYGSVDATRLASVTVGGSLSGTIRSDVSMGLITISQDIEGDGLGSFGSIFSGGRLAGVAVGGSLNLEVNQFGEPQGGIHGDDIGFVKIGQNVVGADVSGSKIASVSIGGSLLGLSSIKGIKIGHVAIGHDVEASSISGEKIKGVKIGGSLVGGLIISGDAGSDGDGEIGWIVIGGDIDGRATDTLPVVNSLYGGITVFGKLAGVRIGGSLIGGFDGTGSIWSSADMGPIVIGQNLVGGSTSNADVISAGGKLASVTIGGSFIGGTNGDFTNGYGGIISSGSDMGPVKIGGDVKTVSITIDETVYDSSFSITSGGRIASIQVGGSIVIESNATHFSVISAPAGDIGSLNVSGSIIGTAASPVIIGASGQNTQGATTYVAIGRINVGGRVEFANILADYDTDLSAVNGDAQIGAVSVGGDWIASNLVAGAKNLGADDLADGTGANADNVNYGDSHDASIGAGAANILAKIASITIGGQVFGTPASLSATDHFGFVAEQIGAMKVGGHVIPLMLNAHNDNLAPGQTGDVTIHEV